MGYLRAPRDRVPRGGVAGVSHRDRPQRRVEQPATFGRLTVGSSLKGAIVSTVMQRARWTAHSSFCSIKMVPTRRTMASSFGKMPTTSVRRLISPLRRSIGLVLCAAWPDGLPERSCRRARPARPHRGSSRAPAPASTSARRRPPRSAHRAHRTPHGGGRARAGWEREFGSRPVTATPIICISMRPCSAKSRLNIGRSDGSSSNSRP